MLYLAVRRNCGWPCLLFSGQCKGHQSFDLLQRSLSALVALLDFTFGKQQVQFAKLPCVRKTQRVERPFVLFRLLRKEGTAEGDFIEFYLYSLFSVLQFISCGPETD